MSPGPQFFRYQIFEGPFRPELSKVHHDRQAGDSARFNRILDRSPLGTRIVRTLETDNDVFVFRCHRGSFVRIHILQVLLGCA